MASLTGNKIKDTYQSLLKTNDNGQVTSVSKNITDGFGSGSGLYLKDTGVTLSGSVAVSGTLALSGISQAQQTNILTYDTASGQIYYTASNAIGGVPTLQQVTTAGNTTSDSIAHGASISLYNTTRSYAQGISASLGTDKAYSGSLLNGIVTMSAEYGNMTVTPTGYSAGSYIMIYNPTTNFSNLDLPGSTISVFQISQSQYDNIGGSFRTVFRLYELPQNLEPVFIVNIQTYEPV